MVEARKAAHWIDDADLPSLDYQSPWGVSAASVAVPGAGHLLNGRVLPGIGIVAGAAAVVGAALWLGLGGWTVVLTVAAGAALAPEVFRDRRAINGYVAARENHRLNRQHTTNAEALRLLKATDPNAIGAVLPSQGLAAAALPGAVSAASPAETVEYDLATKRVLEKLRQGFKLYQTGMLSKAEYKDRKVEIFSNSQIVEREGMDALMEALVPLYRDGLVDDEDLSLMKAMADVSLELWDT